jgi:hypothetical protein
MHGSGSTLRFHHNPESDPAESEPSPIYRQRARLPFHVFEEDLQDVGKKAGASAQLSPEQGFPPSDRLIAGFNPDVYPLRSLGTLAITTSSVLSPSEVRYLIAMAFGGVAIPPGT